MRYKDNWAETQERFRSWWNRSNTDRPLMRVVAKRKTPLEGMELVRKAVVPRDAYMDVENMVKGFRNYCRRHSFMAEAFPCMDLNLGAGSLAIYLGSEPRFAWDTVWFNECIDDIESYSPLNYDEDNHWWKVHLDMLKKAQEMAGNDFIVTIPDLVEGIDILSAMRGPQNLCYDLMDHPELVKSYAEQLDNLYFKYYDPIYDIVKDPDGGSTFTAFKIWGPGKTAKIQCDFCAMMSPGHFREFVQPSLRNQCQKLDFSMYHLDGPDAVKHLDALMEIEELDALQWTAGAGRPGGQSELWYPIYDKVRAAGKSIWIWIDGSSAEELIAHSARLVKRYGAEGLYFLYNEMEEDDADKLLAAAEHGWK